jgi:hypothetical protein
VCRTAWGYRFAFIRDYRIMCPIIEHSSQKVNHQNVFAENADRA